DRSRRNLTTIVFRVGVVPRHDHGAVEGHTRKQTLVSTIGVDGSQWGNARARGSPNRPCGHADVAAEVHVRAVRGGFDGLVCIENHDELGDLDTGLKAKARTSSPDRRWTAPAVLCTRYDDPLAAPSAENEPGFHRGHDGEPFRVFQDVIGDRLLGHFLEALKN